MPGVKAGTPTLAPGNRLPRGLANRGTGLSNRGTGFTLIELLVVVSLVAISAATITLALRDPAAAQLDREAERLAALFETARAESRAAGLNVQWAPVRADSGDQTGDQFRFMGLPRQIVLPRRWLGEPPTVEIGGGALSIKLGPEPLIGAQQLQLRLGDQRLLLTTDGLSPFEVKSP